jgi:hypothetical protein
VSGDADRAVISSGPGGKGTTSWRNNQCLLQVLVHNFIERRASGPVLEEMAKVTVSYDIMEG